MLVIRPSQIESLRAARVARFALRLERHLKTAGHTGPLRDVIAFGIANAAAFGLSTERDVARLVELLDAYGASPRPGIELPRPALSVLLRYGMDPRDKLDRFEQWLRDNRR
ncbi:MAG: hypothetical protein ACKV2U_01645 [Bryobacteraceae bacterium]